MDTAPQPFTAQLTHITNAFTPSTPVYTRRRIAGMDKIVLADCVSVSSGTLILRWSDSPVSCGPPRVGEEVTCQSLIKGVLYMTKGVVSDIAEGKQPRLRINLAADYCTAVSLRRYPRYSVQGRLRLSQPGTSLMYTQNSFHSLNISLGGFGLELPEGSWEGSDETEFLLELMVERNGKADENLPGTNLAGMAQIKRRHSMPERQAVYMGFQFDNLPSEQLQSLDFWISTHSAFMRAV